MERAVSKGQNSTYRQLQREIPLQITRGLDHKNVVKRLKRSGQGRASDRQESVTLVDFSSALAIQDCTLQTCILGQNMASGKENSRICCSTRYLFLALKFAFY